MPIKIGFRGIWEFMEEIDPKYEMKSKAFLDAIMVRRGLDLTSPGNENSILRALHFGIYRTDSEPIVARNANATRTSKYVTRPVTSYSLAPNDNFRTSLALQSYIYEGVPPKKELVCSYDEKWLDDVLDQNQGPCTNKEADGKSDEVPKFTGMRRCAEGHFVCGLETVVDERQNDGSRGLLGLALHCCPLGYTSFSQNTRVLVHHVRDHDVPSTSLRTTTTACPRTEFIENVRVRVDSFQVNLDSITRGITTLP
jgi:hypothetical protein